MNIILGIIVGLLVLTLLVVAHEGGHFLAAKRNGVKVNEFGIGFPPRAICWIKKDGKWTKLPKSEWDTPQKTLIFSLNWLPIGGFCAMDGESADDPRPHTFGAASYWQKTKILFAGVAANWLVAFIVLTILAWTGMPHLLENQFTMASDTQVIATPSVAVADVLPDSPAAQGKLQANDIILSITPSTIAPAEASANLQTNSANYYSAISDIPDADTAQTVNITTPDDVTSFNQQHAGQAVYYTVERTPSDATVSTKLIALVILNPTDSEYLLGISMQSSGQTLYRNTWSAPLVGLATTVQLTGETYRGFGELIWNFLSGAARQLSFDDATREAGRQDIKKAGDSVSGPVGIIGVLFPAYTSAGPTIVAFLAAVISISLACMNVLPIPALDGGRWFLITIYRLRKKPLSKETEAKIVSRAFIVLIAIILLITVLDIIRISHG